MKNETRIAVVIAADNLKEMLSLIEQAKALTTWVEIRADYLFNISKHDIDELALATSELNVLFTLRGQDFGGKFSGSTQARLELFEYALTKNFAFYDVDFAAVEEYSPIIKSRMDKIILSHHNFKETPKNLEEILKKMMTYKPKICKFATQVENIADVEVLENLLKIEKNQQKIVIGMGEFGKFTRFMFPFLGSFLTFAAFGESKSAPGQIQIQDLQNIFKILNR